METLSGRAGLTVLVVDDEPDVRCYVRQCLGSLKGVIDQVLEAPDGDEALQLAHAVSLDLIIADVVMPGLDGESLCSRVKTDPRLSRIQVLLMTGDECRRVGERREAGADAVLHKPFNARELIAQIRGLGLAVESNA